MGHQSVPSGLDNEGYSKEVGEISDYAFGVQIQSISNVCDKPLAM